MFKNIFKNKIILSFAMGEKLWQRIKRGVYFDVYK